MSGTSFSGFNTRAYLGMYGSEKKPDDPSVWYLVDIPAFGAASVTLAAERQEPPNRATETFTVTRQTAPGALDNFKPVVWNKDVNGEVGIAYIDMSNQTDAGMYLMDAPNNRLAKIDFDDVTALPTKTGSNASPSPIVALWDASGPNET